MECPRIRLTLKSDNGRKSAAHATAPALGQRATRQRKLIFDILSSTEEHLDVESLYRKARDLDSRVSLSTVYRTISLLKESDLVDELVFDDDRRCYEIRKDLGHHHIRCLSCGEIVEFESECARRMAEKLQNELGCEVQSLKIEASGYCRQCRASR